MPRTPDEIVAVLRNERCVEHDVGRIDFPGARPRWFINVAGAGLDAHVIERLPRRITSRLAYLAGAVRALRGYRAPLFQVDARQPDHRDDPSGTTLCGRFLVTFVANGRYCGHRMDIAPDAIRDDGFFEIVAIDAVGLGTALENCPSCYRGTLLADRIVHHARGASVHVSSSRLPCRWRRTVSCRRDAGRIHRVTEGVARTGALTGWRRNRAWSWCRGPTAAEIELRSGGCSFPGWVGRPSPARDGGCEPPRTDQRRVSRATQGRNVRPPARRICSAVPLQDVREALRAGMHLFIRELVERYLGGAVHVVHVLGALRDVDQAR